ncbi:hypothetical protein BGX38DRAFT_1271437 [Terfezia claveryi]|nr:hypothetical protein BGX38DRAFT_1271437 [Terfezia claveryi]
MPKAHKPRKQSNVKDVSKKWDDILLRLKHENPEASWKMIQKRFNEETGEGKRIEALQMRVHRRQQEGVIWSNDQEQVLNEIVQQETKKFWKNVSSSIQARIGSLVSGQSCEKKWREMRIASIRTAPNGVPPPKPNTSLQNSNGSWSRVEAMTVQPYLVDGELLVGMGRLISEALEARGVCFWAR